MLIMLVYPLGRIIRLLQSLALWTPASLTLSCLSKTGKACRLLKCPIEGDTPYFAAVQFWMLRRALQLQRPGQKAFTPQLWQQLCQTTYREGLTLVMGHVAQLTNKEIPDEDKSVACHSLQHMRLA